MNDLLFLVDDDGTLHEMTLSAYAQENDLQELLARNPRILSAISDDLRPFLLVRREMKVPDSEGARGRWSIDHLFLDRAGVPTLVETKRSSDTRLRREVIGQMLDYAANGLTYWPPGEIRRMFESRCEHEQIDPTEAVVQFLGDATGDVERILDVFWEKVVANLRAEEIRLVFVSDDIPRELERIIEYLNDHMRATEVVGLELKHFVSNGRRTLLPRVVGRTAKAQQRRAVERGATVDEWDEEKFMTALEEAAGTEARRVAAEILRWAESRGLRIHWSGTDVGTFTPILSHAGAAHRFVKIGIEGTIRTQFNVEKRLPPFNDPDLRRNLLARLNSISGVQLPDAAIDGKKHSFPLNVLSEAHSLERFFETFDWFINRVRH